MKRAAGLALLGLAALASSGCGLIYSSSYSHGWAEGQKCYDRSILAGMIQWESCTP